MRANGRSFDAACAGWHKVGGEALLGREGVLILKPRTPCEQLDIDVKERLKARAYKSGVMEAGDQATASRGGTSGDVSVQNVYA